MFLAYGSVLKDVAAYRTVVGHGVSHVTYGSEMDYKEIHDRPYFDA